MSKKKRKPVTAKELLDELRANPEWVAGQKAQERRRRAWSAALLANEAPVVADLRTAGFDVNTVSDLFNRKEPWRKDVPIPPWPEAVPILIEHLDRPYSFEVREGIVRALTAPWGRLAFDRLVEEFRRTADPAVAAEEQRKAVELVMAEAGDLYTRDEVEQIMRHRWDSYRFALANAIVYHFEQEHIPLIVGLIRHSTDEREEHWQALADEIRKKRRRWRRKDPDVGSELLALVESLRSP
ncbi:MAG: hypothetical protein Kow0062_28400 [Acidobacteriota bacterium]